GHSFTDFARARSEAARQALLTQPFAPEDQARFVQASAESIEAQKAIEAADTMPFEIYRQQYVSPARLGLGARSRSAVTVCGCRGRAPAHAPSRCPPTWIGRHGSLSGCARRG
ncbi:MAG: hypothetical protein WA159_23555, partial [Variovorax sp.]